MPDLELKIGGKLSKNFTLKEFCKSQTATRHGIDNIPTNEEIIKNIKAVAKNILQPIRDYFEIPFSPNSGYRSPELNQLLKSKPTSQHCLGQAVDIEIPTIDNMELAGWISENLEYDQIILEYYKQGEPDSGWVHVSYFEGNNRKKFLAFDGKQYFNVKAKTKGV